ncbi:MAG TPA: adenylyl-sulfate kinase [Terriglobia bacterium]|jgi:adenylylsulfate kinase
MQEKGIAVWFTGLSGSGKTTLSRALGERMREAGLKVEVLDGDEARKRLSKELGFSKEDRDIHIRRLGYLAALLSRHGIVVIVAAISPYREAREMNRQEIGTFVEVYCKCPLDVAESRDIKGLYKRARAGQIKSFTGIDDPYEEPLNPDVLVNTDTETVAQSLEKIYSSLRERGYL